MIATPSTTAPLSTGQKVKNAPNADDSGNSIAKPGTGQKNKHTGDANKPRSRDPSAPKTEKRSRSGRAIKPTEKAKDQNQELVAYLKNYWTLTGNKIRKTRPIPSLQASKTTHPMTLTEIHTKSRAQDSSRQTPKLEQTTPLPPN